VLWTLRNLFGEKFGKNRFSEWLAHRVWEYLWDEDTRALRNESISRLWLLPTLHVCKCENVQHEMMMWADFYAQ